MPKGGLALRRAVLALVAVAPMVLGGTDPYARAVLYGVCLVVLLAHLLVGCEARRWPGIAWAALLLGLWTLARSVPGSGALAASPIADIWALWPDQGARMSAAPGLAAGAAWRCAGVAAIAAVCASRFATTERMMSIARAVVVGAVGVVALGVAQKLGDADARYFVVPARMIDQLVEPLSGPYVNANQAGAYVGLGGVCAAGLSWAVEARRTRALYAAFALVAGAFVAANAAYGALLAFALAIVTLLTAAIVSEVSRHPAALKPLVWLAAVAVATFALFVYGATSLPLPEFLSHSAEGKIWLWRSGASLVGDSPWTGWGPYSFVDIIPALAPRVAQVRFTWIESFPAQVAFDHGLPAFAIAGVATCGPMVAWMTRRGRSAHVPHRGAALALGVYVAVEAVLGMGLHGAAQAIGVAALIASISGMAAARRALRRDDSDDARATGERAAQTGRWLLRRVNARVQNGIALGLVAVVALGSVTGLRGALWLEAHAHERFDDGVLPDDDAIAARAHATPADPRVIGAAAYRALQSNELQRAQQLADWLAAHASRRVDTWRLAAAIAQRDGDQAGVCDATRHELEIRFSDGAMRQLDGDVRSWLACVPDDPQARDRVYGWLRGQDRNSEVLAMAMRQLRISPDDAGAAIAAGRAALALGMVEPAGWYGARAREAAPYDERGWLLSANVAQRRGDNQGALAVLDLGIAQISNSWTLRAARVEAFLELLAHGSAPENWIAEVEHDLSVINAGIHVGGFDTRDYTMLRIRFDLETGSHVRAAAASDAWLRRSPNDVDVVRYRLEAAVAGGDRASIERWALRLLELAPGDRTALRHLP